MRDTVRTDSGDGSRYRVAPRVRRPYLGTMTDADRIEALLDIVDDSRTEQPAASEQLAVLGLVERRGKSRFWPTNAGWNLMSSQGRPFDVASSARRA